MRLSLTYAITIAFAIGLGCALAPYVSLFTHFARYEDRSDCRSVALRAVEEGVPPNELGVIRDACISVLSKSR